MEHPNIDYIKALSGGETAFEKELVRIIKTELPKEIDTYESQLKEGDYLSAAQSVHKLKHKISILGMTQAYDLAVKYEEDLKKSQTGHEQSFKDVLQLMSRFINELNL